MTKQLKVLFVGSELTPIAKVGGLGDVISALPKALKKLGVDVRIAIPKYGVIDEKRYPMKKIASDIKIPFNGKTEKFNILETPLPGSKVPVYLLDNLEYLGQNGVYFEANASSSGAANECARYCFLCRASLAVFEPLNWWPDIIHCNDWHTGILPALTKLAAKKDSRYKKVKPFLSLHNLAYQGIYQLAEVKRLLGLTDQGLAILAPGITGEQINFIKEGIVAAEIICPVSPAYAQEILTPEYGEGLHEFLQTKKDKIHGILNGIDVDFFNPKTDPEIKTNYAAESFEKKLGNKLDLQKHCGLKQNKNTPIIGSVGRLADQKGIDLYYEIIDDLAKQDLQMIFLGAGDPALEKFLTKIDKRYLSVYTRVGFDARLARLIYAGADMFAVPSRFEPCGLIQMIAMRYGTVPIVRATGGLKDTVPDIDKNPNKGLGFVFEEFSAKKFHEALMKALKLFREDKIAWKKIAIRGMRRDFSWTNSAKKYLDLYYKIANS